VTEHLKTVNENYFKHLMEAWRISASCVVAALAAFVHGLFPGLMTATATNLLKNILSRHHERATSVATRENSNEPDNGP